MIIMYKGVRYDTLQGVPWFISGQEAEEELDPKAAGQPSITPSSFDEAIGLTVTANGVYNAPAGKAYNPVSVQVADTPLTELTVTSVENGEVTYTGAYKKVTVVTNVDETVLKNILLQRPGTYRAYPGEAYKEVTVEAKTGLDAVFTTNGAKSGLFYDPQVLVPAERESVPEITFTENGEYETPEDKVYEKIIVDLPEPKATYFPTQYRLEFENVELELA